MWWAIETEGTELRQRGIEKKMRKAKTTGGVSYQMHLSSIFGVTEPREWTETSRERRTGFYQSISQWHEPERKEAWNAVRVTGTNSKFLICGKRMTKVLTKKMQKIQ